MTSSFLTIDKLEVVAGEQVILRNLNLVIAPGEIHVLMGPNGSGKSTLCHALLGHPSYVVRGGTIKWQDQDLLTLSIDARARAGLFLAWQHPYEIPGVSLPQLVRAALNARADKDSPLTSPVALVKTLKGYLKDLGLSEEFLARSLHENASGGEKKRLELVQLLMLNPRLAMLDEIDSGVDIDALQMMAKIIMQQAQSANTAFLIITHYPRLTKFVTPHQVHILKEGAIVASGGPELAERVERDGYGAFGI